MNHASPCPSARSSSLRHGGPMKQKVIWGGLVFGAVLFLLSGALEVRSARGEEKLLVAYAGHSESVAHMWVGIEKGLFKKYGLDVRMLQVRSGPLIAATLASGSVQVVWTAPSSMLSAASAGGESNCLGGTAKNFPPAGGCPQKEK